MSRPFLFGTHLRSVVRAGVMSLLLSPPIFAQLDVRVARPTLTLGAEEGGNATVFGDVAGLELAHDGRMIVADRLGPSVVIIASDGMVEQVLGRSGAGPGDFASPCCVALSRAQDELWVVDPQLSRLTVFEWPTLALSKVVRAPPEVTLRPDKPMFLESGDVAVSAHGGTPSTALVHFILSPDGDWLRRVQLPPPPTPDSLGYGEATIARLPKGDGEFVEIGQLPPFSPQWLLVRGPSGAFARGVSSRFSIDVFGPDGSHVGRISRDVRGPLVTDDERRTAEARVDSLAETFESQGGSYPDLSIPERKPPIRAMWFDADGQIWVQENLEGSSVHASALVFDHSGRELFRALWPGGVRLHLGAIRGMTALGVVRDRNGVEAVVRLQFHRQPADAGGGVRPQGGR